MRQKLEGRKSPLNPTELGWKYLKGSGLDTIIDEKNRDWLLENLKNSLSPNYTDYDVQDTARRVMVSLRDDPMLREIKEYAFKKSLDVDLLLRLGGLLLRDNFFGQKHTVAPPSSSK